MDVSSVYDGVLASGRAERRREENPRNANCDDLHSSEHLASMMVN